MSDFCYVFVIKRSLFSPNIFAFLRVCDSFYIICSSPCLQSNLFPIRFRSDPRSMLKDLQENLHRSQTGTFESGARETAAKINLFYCTAQRRFKLLAVKIWKEDKDMVDQPSSINQFWDKNEIGIRNPKFLQWNRPKMFFLINSISMSKGRNEIPHYSTDQQLKRRSELVKALKQMKLGNSTPQSNYHPRSKLNILQWLSS